jgi:hypothetical protein
VKEVNPCTGRVICGVESGFRVAYNAYIYSDLLSPARRRGDGRRSIYPVGGAEDDDEGGRGYVAIHGKENVVEQRVMHYCMQHMAVGGWETGDRAWR